LLAALGVAVEFLQGMTGYRHFEPSDMVANANGVLLGWVWARTVLGKIGSTLETKLYK
jgi:VanZ family protein